MQTAWRQSGAILKFAAAFQFRPERRYYTVDCFYVLDREPIREAIDPWSLQAHGGFERLPSLIGQNDELRPPVMGVGLKRDKSLLAQIVDNPLNVLTIGPEVASQPRHRLRTFGRDDCTESLPTCARQSKRRY